MFNINFLLILGSVAIISIGQLLFKTAAKNLRTDEVQSYIELFTANLFPALLVFVALTLYLVSTVAWIQALRTVPLSVAFMFNSLAFVLVPAAAFLIFGEQMPTYFLPGLLLIVVGIILISW
jgi:multidrug transporter EmrE-like cation transporter